MNVVAYMIVKNEAQVIERALRSLTELKPRGIVIVDTGSTDDTIARAADLCPTAFIFQRPWVDFGHNRTEALKLASVKGDWVLRLDADQTISGEFPAEGCTEDAYNCRINHGTIVYRQPILVRSSMPWRFEGATHEFLTCDQPHNVCNLDSLNVVEHGDSSRRVEGRKFSEDLAVLKAAVRRNPKDSRSVFYLARTLDDMGKKEHALSYYRNRSYMGTGPEVWYSRYRRAVLMDNFEALFKLWCENPLRWEPAYCGCRMLNKLKFHRAAYALGREVLRTPGTPNGLFAERNVYDYLMQLEHSVSCFWVGEKKEGFQHCLNLLEMPLPGHIRKLVEANMLFFTKTPELPKAGETP